VFPLGISY